jgi:GTP-binding protein
VLKAEFIASTAEPAGFPPGRLPEIAFLGRSNVGKSSLINALCGRKGLAFTSGTPGRTQTINFYRIDGAFYFVDLPGYGYARVPRMDGKGPGPEALAGISRQSVPGNRHKDGQVKSF